MFFQYKLMTIKKIYELYRLVAKNKSLQYRRHPMFEKNRIMRVISVIGMLIHAVYLMALGAFTGKMLEGVSSEAFDCVNGCIIVFLIIDFFFRFVIQDTPAQEMKQYKLLNIPMSFLLNVFIVQRGLNWSNLLCFFYFVPFYLTCCYSIFGISGMIGYLAAIWLMTIANAYWYLLWRTLINRNVFFVVIPVAVYALIVGLGYCIDFDHPWMFEASATYMRGFFDCDILNYLPLVAVIAILYAANYWVQKQSVYREMANSQETQRVTANNMTYLDKFGIVGEYFKLEIKSTIRNLVVRKQFLTGFFVMLMFCMVFSFTDYYDGTVMKVFVCIYCFGIRGCISCGPIMCAEGNYIDALMARKDTVYLLLRAKYYFHCALLVVPMLFFLVPYLNGKISIIVIPAYAFFTSGVIFPFVFQLAVYNNVTQHLNNKITKSGRNTKEQMLVSFLALGLPVAMASGLIALLGFDSANICLLVLGVVGTALHKVWLRNIYKRFMVRRYVNMESFRNSI